MNEDSRDKKPAADATCNSTHHFVINPIARLTLGIRKLAG